MSAATTAFCTHCDVITGKEAWQFGTGAGRLSSPAVSNGVVYVGSDDGYLYAVK